jgi:hypothetical protein
MRTVRRYRLFSLTLLVVGVLAAFLAFFFVWVLAPLALMLAFYVAFVMTGWHRRLLARRSGVDTRLRRERLEHEAAQRNVLLSRGTRLGGGS